MSITFSGVNFQGGFFMQVKPPTGQQAYTTPGTYSWIVPAGVNSVSVVAVGGGGGVDINKPYLYSAGGGGGALAYGNNLEVTPGQTITVFVGRGFDTTSRLQAQGSYFNASSYLYAGPGETDATWGGTSYNNSGSGGGGGAGGYSGSGGQGGDNNTTPSRRTYPGYPSGSARSGGNSGGFGGHVSASASTTAYNGFAGSGGSGGGGVCITHAGNSGPGGGVGIYGEGTSGNGSDYPTSVGGYPGSSGSGKLYGAGGSGTSTYSSDCNGGGGAVRIIWPGNTRYFPSTQTTDMS